MLKKLFLVALGVLGFTQGVSADVLTADQLTSVTTAITSGIGEYVTFMLAVIVITYPATLIVRALRGIGRGRSA